MSYIPSHDPNNIYWHPNSVTPLDFNNQMPTFPRINQFVGEIYHVGSFFCIYVAQYFYLIAYWIVLPLLTFMIWITRNAPAAESVRATVLRPETAQAKMLSETRAKILRNADGIDENDIFALFDSLPEVTVDDMLGHWCGDILRTNTLLSTINIPLRHLKSLGDIRWGKRFRNTQLGDPWVWYIGPIVIPLVLLGASSLNQIKFRGKLSASMTYNAIPVVDHFRLLSAENGKKVMLGIFTVRGCYAGFFTLTKASAIDRALDKRHFVAEGFLDRVTAIKSTSRRPVLPSLSESVIQDARAALRNVAQTATTTMNGANAR